MSLRELEALFHHCMLLTDVTNEKLCKALIQRCIKLVKNLLCYEIFMLLRQEFLFKWETLKRAIHTVTIWENFERF